MEPLPPHLGGHGNETHVDGGVADYLVSILNPVSVLDVGCGVGHMVKEFLDRRVLALGIDGDWTAPRDPGIPVLIHDFTLPFQLRLPEFTLVWSVEFVEHVVEECRDNYLAVFSRCRHLVMTHAIPGQPGHHHVNCRDAGYWQEAMAGIGLSFDAETTAELRRRSTMKADYMRNTGLFFRR